MNLSLPFIARPVMTTVLTVAFLFFGGFAFLSLPVNELPNVDFPTITVNVSLPGAAPEAMASAVATPLERSFSALPGLDSVTSTNMTGSSRIVIQFKLDRDIDAAAQDVQAAVSQTNKQLPPNIDPPEIKKENPSQAPIMHLTLTSPTIAVPLLHQFGRDRVALRLSTVPGIGQIDVNGGQKYAVRLFLDPQALAARKLGFDQVVSAIQAANSNLATGTLNASARTYSVLADGQLRNAVQFSDMIVAVQGGEPIRLKDVGRAEDSVEAIQAAASVNGDRAIEINLKRQPGANTVAVTKAVRAALDEVRASLPGDARLNILYDRSDYINASIHDVELTLLITLVLVVLVVMVFLRNLSATIIVAAVLPTSLIGTLGVMKLMGYSLNNVSLLALTLAVGIVIDDAIVVLENIFRHMQMGKDRRQAALDGAGEIGFTVVSITLSLAAVFLPLMVMGGVVGRLFSEFGVTMAVSVVLSGIVSITLTPMLASRYLQPGESSAPPLRWFDGLFTKAERGYASSLDWCMRRQALMLLLAAALLAGSGGIYFVLGKGFIPRVDSGKIDGNTRVPEGTPFAEFAAQHDRIVKIVQSNPNVASVLSVIGSDGTPGNSETNTGRMLIGLKPREQRKDSADEFIAQVREQTKGVDGIEFVMRNPPAIDLGPQANLAGVQYLLQSTDTEGLYTAAESFALKLRSLPQLKDVSSSLRLRNPQALVTIDRDAAAKLGLNPAKIQDTLQSAFGGRKISLIYASADQYSVFVEVDRRLQKDINVLGSIYLSNASGEAVPLSAVARFTTSVGPLSIDHYSNLPAVTVSFNLADAIALSQVTPLIENFAKSDLPNSVAGRFIGTAQAFQDSLSALPLQLLVTVVLIYLIMAVLYENFAHPITILTALPLAGFGAFALLWISHHELNLFSFVGLILLVGLVKKNGIMMVDFAISSMSGKSPKPALQAMHEACVVRFRPIMMTSLAAIFGTIPIALGYGAGAETRQPLGIAVVGGLLFSQLLTLYVTPVFFLTMERMISTVRGTALTSREQAPRPAEHQLP